MNWSIFNLKYDKREQWAFEKMSYLLFCAELENRIGLFRYKNQVGIETEPLKKNGETYGFQAKYYTVPISGKKSEIIASIKKTKRKNPDIDKILFYINKEFSESKNKGQKKSNYEIEIESTAKKLNVNIIWRVPSHFEIQLSFPENKYINDIFFNIDPTGGNLLDDIVKHNINILQAIQTEMSFEEKIIKIDRSNLIEKINNSVQVNENIIISGEGGSGKTAILKEFYIENHKRIPICIFKASELAVQNINDIFKIDHNFSFNQFLEAYQDEKKKVFAIDSAERLAEITNNTIIIDLIHQLKEENWCIIFTTRYSYLNDLSFHIRESYQLNFSKIDIPIINPNDLKQISSAYKIKLPKNEKFLERLRNLFYLNEYLQNYSNINKSGNLKDFIDILWKKKIQDNFIQNDNLHLQREKCIIYIAKERCNTGKFYINGENLFQPALFKLKQDEILGYDDTHDGFFITHDIYEEWALDKIVSRNYANYSETKNFFDNLGESLPIRRAFRLWLSNQLSESNREAEDFIQKSFTNPNIIQFWKDELLVSILLSDYSKKFFNFFEDEIISDNFYLLKRILFLLRIACTDISINENYDIKKPKGKGWEEAISLVYKYRIEFFEKNTHIILPLLKDWCNSFKQGATTRYSGLLALSIFQKTETEKNFFIADKAEEKILEIVFGATIEIQSELKIIFDKVIANKWTQNNHPYEGLCSKILEKPYLAFDVIKRLPSYVIELCDLFWSKQEIDRENMFPEIDGRDNNFGLTDRFKHKYFPSSANQTPIYWLLQSSFLETLDFIIHFTNRSLENYVASINVKSDLEEIKLDVNGNLTNQYLDWTLWGLYRGFAGPNILQCIYMALEKILLEFAEVLEASKLRPTLLKILLESKSASLTSIVCSITLAYPSKFYDIALILFKTIEFFNMDLNRYSSEFHVKSIASLGYGWNKEKDFLYNDERIKSCEYNHRNSSLESLCLIYQLNGVEGFTAEENENFIKKIYSIIDLHKIHYSENSQSQNNSIPLLLARMDKRNLSHKITEQDENRFVVEFTPKELPEEIRKESEDTVKQISEEFKYTPLRLWSDFTSNLNNNKDEKYTNDPLKALSETKQLIEELKLGKRRLPLDDTIPAFVCSKLIIEYKDILSIENKVFCKEIILATINQLFKETYSYQISDGIEASFHALPSLMEEYPDQTEEFLTLMVWALLDKTSIGSNKRICDYVIESIHKRDLWIQNPKATQALLIAFVKIYSIYKTIYEERRKQYGFGRRISKTEIFEELDKKTTDFSIIKLSIDDLDISSLDISTFETIYQLIPSNTKDKFHLEIFEKSIPTFAPRLLMDDRKYKKQYNDDFDVHSIRLNIFKRFTHFILFREISEIDKYLMPFVDSFDSTSETASLIGEFILAEDKLNKYSQYWHVWNQLYPKIIEVSKYSRSFHLEEIIVNYLLAWKWWNNGIDEWHSLKQKNLFLYANVSRDIGHVPSVLYSITRVLNSIGSHFRDEGIDWIYTIVSNNCNIDLGNLKEHVLFYLEKILRKFILINKQRIKEDIRLKNKIIPILDFMIERGSIHGYLLRESVL